MGDARRDSGTGIGGISSVALANVLGSDLLRAKKKPLRRGAI